MHPISQWLLAAILVAGAEQVGLGQTVPHSSVKNMQIRLHSWVYHGYPPRKSKKIFSVVKHHFGGCLCVRPRLDICTHVSIYSAVCVSL